jgi:predicted transglutaminase-like protease
MFSHLVYIFYYYEYECLFRKLKIISILSQFSSVFITLIFCNTVKCERSVQALFCHLHSSQPHNEVILLKVTKSKVGWIRKIKPRNIKIVCICIL